MTEKEAKEVIKQAIAIAQKSGVYSIQDSALIYQAMLTLGYVETELMEPKVGDTCNEDCKETPKPKKSK